MEAPWEALWPNEDSVFLEREVVRRTGEPAPHRPRPRRMKLSKYLCAVALIIGVAGCQSSAKAGGGTGSSPGASTSGSAATGSSEGSGMPSPSSGHPSLPPPTPLKRVAELGYSGGFILGNELSVPVAAVYSDGTVVFTGDKRLTLTPGALDNLVGTLQADLSGQSTAATLLPKNGHANPDGASTVVAVYQPDGTYQKVYALGLGAGSASQFPPGVGDAFLKLQALTSDSTTPYTSPRVRYSMKCPTENGGTVKPWPSGVPQAGVGQPNTCLEVKTADGTTAAAVRAACTGTEATSGQPQPAPTVYRSANGSRVCHWRNALPDEAS